MNCPRRGSGAEFPCCQEGLAREQQKNTKQVEADVSITLKKDEILPVFDVILLRIRTDMQQPMAACSPAIWTCIHWGWCYSPKRGSAQLTLILVLLKLEMETALMGCSICPIPGDPFLSRLGKGNGSLLLFCDTAGSFVWAAWGGFVAFFILSVPA